MPPPSLGKLYLYRGTMFAGKTRELLRLYTAALELGLTPLVISHAADTRYAQGFVVSPDGEKAPCMSVTTLEPINISECTIIFIDEAQFLPDLLSFCNRALTAGKIVHVFGLHSDYLRREFHSMRQLHLLADKIKTMTAVCSTCGAQATTTARVTPSTERILIGSDQYEARCEACHTVPDAETGTGAASPTGE